MLCQPSRFLDASCPLHTVSIYMCSKNQLIKSYLYWMIKGNVFWLCKYILFALYILFYFCPSSVESIIVNVLSFRLTFFVECIWIAAGIFWHLCQSTDHVLKTIGIPLLWRYVIGILGQFNLILWRARHIVSWFMCNLMYFFFLGVDGHHTGQRRSVC